MIRACSIVHDAVGRPDPRRATHPAAGRCYWCAAPIVERACKVSDVITDSFTDQDQALAYLAGRDLPVHPAYACTMGGAIDRGVIRVSTLGGERGRRFGRAEWERFYYGRPGK